MRVLHVIDELRIGGAQTHLVTFLREMNRRWQDDHIVVGLFGDGPVRDDLEELGIEVQILDLHMELSRRQYLQGIKAVEEVTREIQPDVFEAHLTWSRLFGLPAAWRVGVTRRIGFEQGDLFARTALLRAGNFVGQWFAHTIVVCSDALRRWATRSHWILPSKMTVLHNCVDTERFKPPATKRNDRPADWPSASTVFCAVGTLGHGVDKRTDVSIRAIGEARTQGADVGLIVCGDGEQRRALEDLTERSGLGGEVKFLGTRTDIPEVMAACDGLCHAAPFEPFGIVCLEAMSTGLPVIVPNSGGICEAVENGRTGFLYPALDHKSLARLMAEIAADPDLGSRVGRAARRETESVFSVCNYVERLRAIYAGNRLEKGP